MTKSITPDAMISFIDNKPSKEAFGLPKGYPSVAPNYSAARSEMAKARGLGSLGRNAAGATVTADAPAPAETKAPAIRGRKKADSTTGE